MLQTGISGDAITIQTAVLAADLIDASHGALAGRLAAGLIVLEFSALAAV